MFDSVLIPLDGSPLSDRILTQVQRLLRGAKPRIELYTAVDERDETEAALEAARTHLEGKRQELAQHGADVSVCVDEADPATGILARVRSTQPSLVAMATHGRSGPSRWLRGSVAERVLRECPVPLLLVNPDAPGDDSAGLALRRILVPFDGSEKSAAVLPLVEALASLFQAEVVLQQVWPFPEEGSTTVRDRMTASLAPIEAGLAASGIPARTRKEFGSPAGKILDAAAEEEADLVALTTHGTSGLSRWPFGSATEKVLRKCGRPLLVVSTRGGAA